MEILFSKSLAEVEKIVLGLGEAKFRAKQIREWLGRGCPDFSSMTNMPKPLIEKLSESFRPLPITAEKKLESSDGMTTKFLFELSDGEKIETVLMRTSYGNSVCVSSQAGCAMGCKFCASALFGLKRNLSADEMSAQVLRCQWELRASPRSHGFRATRCEIKSPNNRKSDEAVYNTARRNDEVVGDFNRTASPQRQIKQITSNSRLPVCSYGRRDNPGSLSNFSVAVRAKSMGTGAYGTKPNGDKNQNDVTHLVIMGTGEPLQNIENVITFMRRANSELGVGWRRITLSTCGIVDGIKKLKELNEPINLAISLHAPNDDLRKKIMPIANRHTIADTLLAAFDFAAAHKRQLMIEYNLLGGFNDSAEHASALAGLLKNKPCMVNLIPWNPVAELSWERPSNNQVHRFQDVLLSHGIHSRIRRERGADIDSACGQLRAGGVRTAN